MKHQKKIQTKGIPHTVNKTKQKSQELVRSKPEFLLWLAFIALVVFLSYSPSLKNGITNWDDDQYIEKNPWLKQMSAESVTDMFGSYYMGNYHPLAMLSLSIDYRIAGEKTKGTLNPFIFHLSNLLLHIFNTILVFWLVYLLFGKFEIGIIASLLFGLSSLHVESVAWISERKDVLYAFFFILSLVLYVIYLKSENLKYYLLSLLFFILSLFSKGQAVSLAITLFAIDYLFDRKLFEKKQMLEKIPFLILALVFGIVAIKAQQAGNAIDDGDSYAFYKRIGFAGYAFTQYLVKLLAPFSLSAIYPYPDIINKSIPAYYWLFVIPSGLVVYASFYFRKRSKVIAFGIAFFIINIFLLLQLIPVGSAIWADRYSYIPSIGYYALIAWLIYQLVQRQNAKKAIIYGITGIYFIGISVASFERCKVWNSSLSLWDDTLEKSPKAVVAWNNRGSIKDKDNKHAEAIRDFTNAIELKPDYTHAFYNRGTAKKNLAEEVKDSTLLYSAISDFDYAIKLNHVFVEALHNRGLARENLSDYVSTQDQRNSLLLKALEDYNKTIELNPTYENAVLNRGVLKGKLGRYDDAIADFNTAIQMAPDSAQAYANRGLARDFKGDMNGALIDYNKAIELKPEFDKAYYNRGLTYRKMKNYQASVRDFTEAIKLDPKMSAAYYFRGLDQIVLNLKDLACKDFETAMNLGYPYAKEQIAIYCNK